MTGRTAPPVHAGWLRLSGWHLTFFGVCIALLVALAVGPAAGVACFALWLGVQYREQLAEWGLGRLLSPWTWLQNPALVMGTVVVVFLVVAATSPAAVAPRDPEEEGSFLLEVDGKLYAAPFPPSRFYPLGSDYQARDLLSRIIYGTRRTLSIALTVTLLRVLIGSLFGVLGGWVGGRAGRWAMALSTISAAFPSLLFALLVIVSIGPGTGFIVFVLGLGLTGWASWAQTIAGEIRRIRTLGYMEAAEAMGTPPLTRLFRHVLPNMLPLLIPNMAQEVSAAMLILGELGFLGIFFGTAVRIEFRELLDRTFVPQTMEWGAMLAGTRLEVFNWYWLPLAPALAFFISILGFNLLADGLRQALDTTQQNRLKATVRRRLGLKNTAPARQADLSRSAPGTDRFPIGAEQRRRRRVVMALASGGVVVALLLVLYVFVVQPVRTAQQLRAEATLWRTSAQEALAQGDYDTAEVRFKEVLARVPDDAGAKEGLATVASARTVIPLYDQARQHLDAHQWSAALALLQQIAAEFPGFRDVDALIEQATLSARLSERLAEAQLAYEVGDWAVAISAYEAIRAESLLFERAIVEERLFDSYMRQAAILTATPHLTADAAREAIALYDRAVRLRLGENQQATAEREIVRAYRSALNFIDRQRWLSAVGQLEGVWQKAPDFAGGTVGTLLVQTYLRVAEEQVTAGDDQRAQEYLQRAIAVATAVGPSVTGEVVRAQFAFAQAAQEAGDESAALARYETVLDAVQERPDAAALLASAGLPATEVALRVQIAEDAIARQQWILAAAMYRGSLVDGPLAPARPAPNEARMLLGIGDEAAAVGDSRSATEAYRRAWAVLNGGESIGQLPAESPGTRSTTSTEGETAATEPPAEGEQIYVVVAGDTLSLIAQRFDTTVDAIAALNGIENPALIVVGQRLRIPTVVVPQ